MAGVCWVLQLDFVVIALVVCRGYFDLVGWLTWCLRIVL